jgi:hypothetical protein
LDAYIKIKKNLNKYKGGLLTGGDFTGTTYGYMSPLIYNIILDIL